MLIREETAERLVIEDRPVLLAVALGAVLLVVLATAMATAASGEWIGAAMLALGAVMIGGAIAVFVRRTVLILDRPAALAILRSATVFGAQEDRRDLAEVRGAEVQTGRSGSGTRTARPALLLAGGGTLPLTPVYSSGRGAARAAAAIERWLAAAA